jgi:hypothetical protein
VDFRSLREPHRHGDDSGLEAIPVPQKPWDRRVSVVTKLDGGPIAMSYFPASFWAARRLRLLLVPRSGSRCRRLLALPRLRAGAGRLRQRPPVAKWARFSWRAP